MQLRNQQTDFKKNFNTEYFLYKKNPGGIFMIKWSMQMT